MKEEKPQPPKEKDPKTEEQPATDPGDAGQRTIFNVPPSRFERLVDEVLKKHKL